MATDWCLVTMLYDLASLRRSTENLFRTTVRGTHSSESSTLIAEGDGVSALNHTRPDTFKAIRWRDMRIMVDVETPGLKQSEMLGCGKESLSRLSIDCK